MLKVGDRIIVGDKHADKYGYQYCAGKEGIIESGPHKVDALPYYSVRISGNGGWGILALDCIPLIPKNNREAIRHLEEEY